MTTRHLLAAVLYLSALPATAEVWTGPLVTFTKPAFADWNLAENQDRLTDTVHLTRRNTAGLFNIVVEAGYGPGAPTNTAWAFDGLNGNPSGAAFTADNPALVFTDWTSSLGGQHFLQLNIVGTPGFVRLPNGDIVPIEFTTWASGGGGGGFSYTRGTPAVAVAAAHAVPAVETLAVAICALMLASAALRVSRCSAGKGDGFVNSRPSQRG